MSAAVAVEPLYEVIHNNCQRHVIRIRSFIKSFMNFPFLNFHLHIYFQKNAWLFSDTSFIPPKALVS